MLYSAPAVRKETARRRTLGGAPPSGLQSSQAATQSAHPIMLEVHQMSRTRLMKRSVNLRGELPRSCLMVMYIAQTRTPAILYERCARYVG